MQSKIEKIIFTALTALVSTLGYQALIYIINLNQTSIFVQVALALYVYLMLKILLLYDLHFKSRGSLARARLKHGGITRVMERNFKIYFSTLLNRTSHLWQRRNFGLYFNYLLLPTLIFWSTTIIIYLNFGFFKFQQFFAFFSTLGAALLYWNIKEIFSRKKEIVDSDIFVMLTVCKIYAAAVTFGAAMAILRNFCLPPQYFSLIVFCVSFSLIFQALFQHRLTTVKNLTAAFFISLAQALTAFFVYANWGFNFYTAAAFLTVTYNLLWGSFHYYLDRALSLKAFVEILFISLIVGAMLFGVTNFKARLLDGCDYRNLSI